jgi:hypothetical protein
MVPGRVSWKRPLMVSALLSCVSLGASAQPPGFARPRLLVTQDGQEIKTPGQWTKFRRPEILRTFLQSVHGVQPPLPSKVAYTPSPPVSHFQGKVIQRLVRISLWNGEGGPMPMHVQLYLPKGNQKKLPVLLALAFRGGEFLNAGYPVLDTLSRGYAMAVVHYQEVAVDLPQFAETGLASLFPELQGRPDNLGAIGIWAWGVSRAIDYLKTDPEVDAERIAVFGHSRLGKTALWAGALDQRVKLAISNESGVGGAELLGANPGKTAVGMNQQFPYWFSQAYRKYDDPAVPPVIDQHLLIALMAPRPVYVGSAAKDEYSDPRGEFLGAREASPVYQLFGLTGLPITEYPAIGQPAHGDIGYHVRAGKHGIERYDWLQYLDFMDRHLKLVH